MTNKIKLLTLDEVAEILRVSKRTAWRYYKNGNLEGIKLDGGIRIQQQKLEKFIKEREMK